MAILGTLSQNLPLLTGSIPDTQLVLVPDPTTGELKRTTFGQMKADIVLAIGDLSYLDDIIEVPTVDDLPQPGQTQKIYVITTGVDANKQFRWGGSIYIEFPQGSGDVAAEAIIRGNADAALQANIDAETTARMAADTTLQNNINSEATSRNNADVTLQNNISAEANIRATNDAILQGLINTEGTTRAAADNALDARIEALEAGGGADTTIGTTTVTGTFYTLLESDSNKQILCTSNSPVTITVPAGLPDGFICSIVQMGDGQVTVTGSGATIYNRQSNFSTAGKDAVLGLQSVGTDLYVLSGDTYVEAAGGTWGSITGTLSDQTDLQAALDAKLNASSYNDRFKGKYTTLSALQTAHPTANAGDYAQVDAGAGSNVINYNYDAEDGWIEGGSGSAATTTDELPEGSTNLYFTDARARDAVASVGYLTSASSLAWAKITGAPTTLAGYGITDAYPLTGNPSGFITGVTATTGGTGQTTWAAGDILYASAVNTLSKLAAGTDGYVLTMISGLPAWAAASGGASLPDQTGNAGKFLTTDGTAMIWGVGTTLPAGSNTYIQYNDNGAFGASSKFTFNPITGLVSCINSEILISGGTSTTSIRVGNLQVQSYGVNNQWIGDNLYFNGSNFIRRANGYGSMFYFQGNEGQWRFANTGTAGSAIPGYGTPVLKVNYDGTVALGGSMPNPSGNYSNAVVLINVNGVSIGANGAVPNPSAILEIASLTKGFLPPRITITNWNAIASKAEGLQVWDNTDHAQLWYDGTRTIGFKFNGTKFQGFDGSAWVDLN